MFEFLAKCGKEEYVALSRFNMYKRNWKTYWGVNLFVGIAWGFAAVKEKSDNRVRMAVVGFLIGVVISMIVLKIVYKLLNRQHINSDKSISDNNFIHFYFNEDGIIYSLSSPCAKQNTQTKWDSIYKGYETEAYYFLYTSHSNAEVIPKAAITKGNCEDFSAFLQGKLGKKFKRT